MSVVSWSQVFGRATDEPVLGDPAAFGFAADMWNKAKLTASDIEHAFKEITSGTSTLNCEGLSIDKLLEVIRQFHSPIGDLHRVCGDIERLLREHEDRLVALRAEAGRALARAEVSWGDSQRVRSDLQAHSTTRDVLRRQLDQLALNPDPTLDAQRQTLQHQIDTATHEAQSARSQLDTATGELESCRREWQRIRDAEHDQNHQTIAALHHVHLGALEDPGFLQRVLRHLKPFADFVGHVLDGDIGAALWDLRAALDEISDVLAVIGTVLVVITLVALLFVPGANLAALAVIGAYIAEASVIVAAAKLEVDSLLFASGTKNPETGDRVVITDLAFDGFDLGLSLVELKGAKAALSEVPADQELRSAQRSLRRSGIVDDRFTRYDRFDNLLGKGLTKGGRYLHHEVVKKTAKEVGEHLLDKKKESLHRQQLNLSGVPRLTCPVTPTFAAAGS